MFPSSTQGLEFPWLKGLISFLPEKLWKNYVLLKLEESCVYFSKLALWITQHVMNWWIIVIFFIFLSGRSHNYTCSLMFNCISSNHWTYLSTGILGLQPPTAGNHNDCSKLELYTVYSQSGALSSAIIQSQLLIKELPGKGLRGKED